MSIVCLDPKDLAETVHEDPLQRIIAVYFVALKCKEVLDGYAESHHRDS